MNSPQHFFDPAGFSPRQVELSQTIAKNYSAFAPPVGPAVPVDSRHGAARSKPNNSSRESSARSKWTDAFRQSATAVTRCASTSQVHSHV